MSNEQQRVPVAERVFMLDALAILVFFTLIYVKVSLPYAPFVFGAILLPSLVGCLLYPGSVGRSLWLVLIVVALIGMFALGGIL